MQPVQRVSSLLELEVHLEESLAFAHDQGLVVTVGKHYIYTVITHFIVQKLEIILFQNKHVQVEGLQMRGCLGKLGFSDCFLSQRLP